MGSVLAVLPLAISSAGWTAIGAVGGALVGATAGGLIDWFIGARREMALAKVGARLVAAEIAASESQLAVAQHSSQWWAFYGVSIASWAEYRAVLAVKLSQADFEAVSQGVMVLESIRQKMPETPNFKEQTAKSGFVQVDPQKIVPMRKEAASAYNALAGLAGHDRERDLIKRPGDGD
jgi:hypothetical protein